MDVGGGAALINIDDLKMDSPDVHSINFTNSDSLMMRDGDIGVQLEGDIITKSSAQKSSQEGELNTLDEPVLETIKRDLNAIGNKIWNALLPMKNPKFLLVEWDLWGILFFATYIGVILQQINSQDPQASQFTQVILSVCLGTAAVTYTHVVMLRTKTSIFQYISVLGYCLAPMAASVTITYITGFLFGRAFWLRFILFLVSTGWSVYATSLILKPEDGPINIPYHLVPLVGYYVIIGVLILYHTHAISSYTPVPYIPVPVPSSSTAVPVVAVT